MDRLHPATRLLNFYTMNQGTALLIVEDHPLYREGLLEAISRAMVVGEIRSATSIAAGMAMLNGHDDIDLVLPDWRLPDGDGLDFLRSVALRHPTVGRALMSGTDDPRLPALCAAEGILGFLPKSLEPSDTILVLHRLLNGETWFPAGKADERMLSPRQTEILEGIAGGLTNKHLARNLGITERTVKHHLTAIFDRLGTTRRAEAVSRAVEQGLIRLPRR